MTDAKVTQLALDLAARVRDAVAPSLGLPSAHEGVGIAPGGDVTMAIDEIAEHVTEQCCVEAGDIAFYSKDRGYVEFGTPRAILVIDPVDGTRPAAAGFEAGCVSVAVLPPSRDATLGEVSFGVVHEIKSGDRFVATRGAGTRVERCDGSAGAIALSANTDLHKLFFASGVRGRPSVAMAVLLEDLVDDSSMHGGYFDLGSCTYDMTRIVTGQLDAYIDPGLHALTAVPALEPAFRRAGEGRICSNFPYDVAAATLIVEEAGGVVTLADGHLLAPCPAVGSGDGFGLAVVASASRPLHDRLLEAVAQGIERLRTHLGPDRAVH